MVARIPEVIDRYCSPEMAGLWTDAAQLDRWLDVEVAWIDALGRAGLIPTEDPAAIRSRLPTIDETFVARCAERERVVRHDVAAFVDVLHEVIGMPECRWIHFGLTSSDVVDTALGILLAQCSDILLQGALGLAGSLLARGRELQAEHTMGRTHGRIAEPITWGSRFGLWGLQVLRDVERLKAARTHIAVGKFSGAVGTWAYVSPEVEADACHRLGLTAVPASQIVSRDRHAEYLWTCATVGATVEMIALNIRLASQSGIDETTESFGTDQKGSSAMPAKQNPVMAEQLCGLARVLRANAVVGLEDVALWFERDLTNSAPERIVLADSTMLADHLLRQATSLITNVGVHGALVHHEAGAPEVATQAAMLRLVKAGWQRDEAYRLIQSAGGDAASASRLLAQIADTQPVDMGGLTPDRAASRVLDLLQDALDNA